MLLLKDPVDEEEAYSDHHRQRWGCALSCLTDDDRRKILMSTWTKPSTSPESDEKFRHHVRWTLF